MTLPANLNVYISVALFVVGAYVAALYVGLIVWTFRDIHVRSKDMLAQILATLLVAIFTLPGLVVYMLLRPQTTLAEEYDRSLTEEAILQDLEERRVCPSCQHRVDPDFIVCPYCHHQLRLRCVGCGRLLHPNWSVCPYCGLFRDQDVDEPAEIEEPFGEEPAPETLLESESVAEAVESVIEESDQAADEEIVADDILFEETEVIEPETVAADEAFEVDESADTETESAE